ncbi:MAG TPA: serine/threonine-protein kinase [Planctomycetota bacterium]|nr:serine/threonine-protein kinase [Planctomycetota bacterium]
MRVDEERPTRADPSPRDPFLGQIVGGCRIDEVLGRGGMGVVYKATQLSLNRPVAIKVLPEEVCGQPQFVERLKREVDVLSRLSHPNVVTVLERGETEGRLYVIMEYVHGTSLREVIRKGPLPAAEALVIVRGVLSALEHAHDKGIVHRDIKPENVLVAPGGIVKVADFGLSRLLDPGSATRLTHTQLLLGTFEYTAPEQREKAKEADERADIYATGVVLYEMLAGELPIGHFAALSRKRPNECDSRIDAIVEKSLAKSPEDRYQRASEMGAAVSRVLSAAMAPEPPPAAPPPPPPPREEPRRKRPEIHVAARLTAEEDACIDAPRRRRWDKKYEDPASGVGCLAFLVLLFAGRGLLVAILGAILAVVVVRALARSGGVVRGVVGLGVIAAVVGALLLFTGGRAPTRPEWLGLPGYAAVETRGERLYASATIGSAHGPMPDLDRFLDAERVAWIEDVAPVPFGVGRTTVDVRTVDGKVVMSVTARRPESPERGSFDMVQLQRLGAAVARALKAAYPGAFVAGSDLPEIDTTAAGPPPGEGDR